MVSNTNQLEMKSKKDEKNYLTDTLDTKGILRLIESVSSLKAEPFKPWLASLGSEKIDEVFVLEKELRRTVISDANSLYQYIKVIQNKKEKIEIGN